MRQDKVKANRVLTFVIYFFIAAIINNENSAFAAEFFVDASGGNDSWSGSVEDGGFEPAGCETDRDTTDCTDGPWASLARIAEEDLLGGDIVHLRCGETWHEQLLIHASGEAGNPIRYTSYGDQCSSVLPVISGAVSLTTWQSESQADVYSCDELSVATTQIFMDNERITVAREPNPITGADPYRYITDESTEVSETLTARHYLIDTLYWSEVGSDPVGAEIRVRNNHFRLQDRIVTGFDETLGHIRWDDESVAAADLELSQCTHATEDCQYPDNRGICAALLPGYGYFLANLRWMLDYPNEWFQNQATHRVLIQMPAGDAPTSHALEASVVDYLIYAQSREYFEIDSIELIKSRLDSVRIERSQHFTVNNLVVEQSGGSGFYVTLPAEGSEVTISGNRISNSTSGGLVVRGGSQVSVVDNVITDTGHFEYANPEGLTYLTSSRGIGIALGGGTNYTVARNLIERSGYGGIQVGGSIAGSSLTGNRIDLSCLLLDDGGGIYIGGTPGKDDDMDVVGNMISYSLGNDYGVPSAWDAAAGVYLDADCMNIRVRDNVVWGVSARGVFLHNAYENTITGNILYSNGIEIGLHENFTSGLNEDGNLYDNQISGNTLFHIDDSPSLRLESTYDDFDESFNFGTFEENVYNGLYHDQVIAERYTQNDAAVRQTLTLEEWQELRGQGAGSELFRPFSFAPYRVVEVSSDNMVLNQASTMTSPAGAVGSRTRKRETNA